MKAGVRLIVAAALAAGAALAARTGSPEGSVTGPPPREMYQALNALRVDPGRVYSVNQLRLRHDAVSLIFSEGTIGFLEAYNGRVTGVVFSGQGHVSAVPRDPAEKQSLAHFLGVPLLDQNFSTAYLRFDDGTADDILAELRRGGENPISQPDFASSWDKTLVNLNPSQTPRILLDWTADSPVPFFYAELVDEQLGPFDILIDGRRTDAAIIGQTRWVGGNSYYDVWASFAGANMPPAPPVAFVPVSYAIDTTIDPDRTLEGTATIQLRAQRSGERAVGLGLSRYLKVQTAQDAAGRPLDFFQNDTLSQSELPGYGNDSVLVILPEAANAGQTYQLRLTYRGSVIREVGNGQFYAGDRSSWYPHIRGMSYFVPFDTTFRWSRKLHLVATGEKVSEREEGDWRVGHWKSDGPILVAGFNLSEHAVENVQTVDGIKIEMSASPQPERAAADPLAAPDTITDPALPPGVSRRLRNRVNVGGDEPADPTVTLSKLGDEIAQAIEFEQQWMGRFPFHALVVSQIPGPSGQGWPGLLYLPALSFLPAGTEQGGGVTGNMQETFDEVVPYHEVAHQWWGNVVGWEDYHDQWLTEGLANYVALVGADAKNPGAHLLPHWLDHYRKALTSRTSAQRTTADEAGPLVYGFRLNSSRDPGAYDTIIYGKGAWVFHMLRMMLQDPASNNPDGRFMELLRGLLESRRYAALTTADLQHAVERVMTPAMALEGGHSMDWFFDEFVRATGVPAYELEFTARPAEKGFLIRGKLIQQGVPDDFVLRVPIYMQSQGQKPALLGYVITSGEETAFQFESTISPKRLLIDPQMTLLCLSSSSSEQPPE